MQGHWGGYQDGTQTIADVGSGIGAVHNSYMFDREFCGQKFEQLGRVLPVDGRRSVSAHGSLLL